MELFTGLSYRKSAYISDCGKYRYSLYRTWDIEKPQVMFIMLNPSTADEKEDDPTIRRCIGFAKSWDYGGICVLNLFAYRATKPKELLNVSDPIGKENGMWFTSTCSLSDMIVCAWGNSAIVNKLLKRFPDYRPLHWISKPVHHLGLSKDGTPKHPLYLKSDLKPIKYTLP